jgi:hypothetical protein
MSSLRATWSSPKWSPGEFWGDSSQMHKLSLVKKCNKKCQIICFIWLLNQIKIQRILCSHCFSTFKECQKEKQKQITVSKYNVWKLTIFPCIPYHRKTRKRNVQSHFFFMCSWQLSSIWNMIWDVLFKTIFIFHPDLLFKWLATAFSATHHYAMCLFRILVFNTSTPHIL